MPDDSRAEGAEDPNQWSASGERILVVDDDPANLLAIEAALGDLGHNLVTVRSGQAALKALLDEDFVLILLDVQLPGLSGFETAALIRQRPRSRHVPIIFFTAHHRTNNDMLRGYELGAVDFLFKPIEPTVLRAKASVFVALRRHTERVRRLEKEAELQRLADARQRWEAVRLREENQRKDEFLAVLGHELRNPLSPIVTSLELFKGHEFEDPRLRFAHEAMSRQLSHLIKLVDDLLDVSRIRSGKIRLQRETLALRAVMEQAVEATREAIAAREHELAVEIPDEPLWVDADEVRLCQVVANLLTNAARYTERGGHIRLALASADGEAVVRVEDDGQGIEPGSLLKIFEPFAQEADVGGGLGIGLALVQKLIALHGGLVTAESEGEGKGSTFTVRLPLAEVGARAAMEDEGAGEGPPEASDEAPAPARPRAPGNGSTGGPADGAVSVVIIDDDDDVRTGNAMLLAHWGYEVHEAAGGRVGVDMVERVRPAAVFVDIGMPEFDGFEVARTLRERLGDKRPHLVALTGYGALRGDEEARAAFDAHLIKPVDPALLREQLRALRAPPP